MFPSAQSANLPGDSPNNEFYQRQVLVEALENADKLLGIAKSDKQRIAEAVKMNDGETTPSGADILEQLRWFIHPRECALLLSQGIESVPGTDLRQLEGGLNPLPCHKSTFSTPNFDGIFAGATTNKTPQAKDGKRKQGSIGTPIFAETKKHKTVDNTEEKKSDLKPPIQSSYCSLDAKNEKKKPSRGSSAWGQGSFAQPSTSVKTEVDSNYNDSGGQKAMEPPVTENGVTRTEKKKKKRGKFKHIQPPPKLMRNITQACIQFNMLEEGDKLLLGLSGGKDSLSLLHCLLECRRKLPINFEIEVCTSKYCFQSSTLFYLLLPHGE